MTIDSENPDTNATFAKAKTINEVEWLFSEMARYTDLAVALACRKVPSKSGFFRNRGRQRKELFRKIADERLEELSSQKPEARK